MKFKYYVVVGMIILSHNQVYSPRGEEEGDLGFDADRSGENDYSQLSGMDVDKIGMNDDLSKYTQCGHVFAPGSAVMGICKNNSICRLLPGPEGYLQVFCDCSNTITETYYYMGPQCETKMQISYSQTITGFLNTSWLEDLFAKNSWKNDFSRVGLLY